VNPAVLDPFAKFKERCSSIPELSKEFKICRQTDRYTGHRADSMHHSQHQNITYFGFPLDTAALQAFTGVSIILYLFRFAQKHKESLNSQESRNSLIF